MGLRSPARGAGHAPPLPAQDAGLDEVLGRLEGRRGGEPDENVETSALKGLLRVIQDMIEQKVHAECYDQLKPRDEGGWCKKNMSLFAREWGFSSLLGAWGAKAVLPWLDRRVDHYVRAGVRLKEADVVMVPQRSMNTTVMGRRLE
jgi:hypothetical protein